ncbi:MAG: hypothetical protein NVS1B5_02070 [Gemmatimonadaceae bacterium]
MTRHSELAQTLFQRLDMTKVERQQMDFVLLVESAQLDSRNYPDTEALTGRARRPDSIDRIMIREGERGQAAPLRRFDYLVGGECTVRCGRVCVQVDERRAARIPAHVA